jgi:hypothetical protein
MRVFYHKISSQNHANDGKHFEAYATKWAEKKPKMIMLMFLIETQVCAAIRAKQR